MTRIVNKPDHNPLLSRLAPGAFVNRESEIRAIQTLLSDKTGAESGLLIGPPRAGKTEVLLQTFDRLFRDSGETAPIYFAIEPEFDLFAGNLLSHALAQLLAFRRQNPALIAGAGEAPAALLRNASAEEYIWAKPAADAYRDSSDPASATRAVFSNLRTAARETGLRLLIILDNVHLLGEPPARSIHAEVIRALACSDNTATLLLGGLQRPSLKMLPPREEMFDRIRLIPAERLSEGAFEKLLRSGASSLQLDVSDSTIDLMVQQLHRDLFYAKALLRAAASRQAGLKTFIEFERLYTEELSGGRIGAYLDSVFRDLAPDWRIRRAAIEALAFIVDSQSPLPRDVLLDRLDLPPNDAGLLVERMHALELLTLGGGFVESVGDPVLADYVHEKYRLELTCKARPVAGSDLLGEKLKHTYRMMMSRHTRAVEARLIDLLSRFDFQSVPASLLDNRAFEERSRGMSKAEVKRSVGSEQEKTRLPQIVAVSDLSSFEDNGLAWRLLAARGFEGGVYSETNEVIWRVALANSKEPVEPDALNRLFDRFEAADRQQGPARESWVISKEGFSGSAQDLLSEQGSYSSNFAQLDALQEYAGNQGADGDRRPGNEFELIIPMEEESELIAARTVEQIARSAQFDQQSINQIKTALVEACLNASEHSDSPDRRIYNRFSVAQNQISITVSSKGRPFIAPTNGGPPEGSRGRGRGLQIIRALMDQVRFEPTDDGSSLVMVKFLKHPEVRS
jgi:serine/threonine-protein kinase RsbW